MDNGLVTKKDLEERLTEKIRDAQTRILRAFYDWARPGHQRMGHVDELAQRLGWLEERIFKLERDKLMGGQH
jgi:hypothetical protein